MRNLSRGEREAKIEAYAEEEGGGLMCGAAPGSAGCVGPAEPQQGWPRSLAAPKMGAESKTRRGVRQGEGKWLQQGFEMRGRAWSPRSDGRRGCPDGASSLHWVGAGGRGSGKHRGSPRAALGHTQPAARQGLGRALVVGLVVRSLPSPPRAGDSELFRR